MVTTKVFNRIVAGLTRLGVSVYGSRVLEVKGRRSGEWRSTPVYLLRYKGGVGPDSADDELRRIAPDHPVFRLSDT